MTPEADLRKALLGVLDDFDRWAGQDPESHRVYAIDKHGAQWAKFIDLMRAALRSPVEHIPRDGRAVHAETVVERLDRPGNRADGVRLAPAHPRSSSVAEHRPKSEAAGSTPATGDHASAVEHMPQSQHGCVNCDRKWYHHTPEEKGRWA